MAGIIKNQILKHLSRYVKKLSSDRINLSTFRGEGELTDLELDEEVLTELLALPIWMKIRRAHCNRAKLCIQWTKLKSVPIRLFIDTIEIEIEACEELRPVVPTPANPHLAVPTAGTYGFADKVVDGMTVTVESVEIRFFSKAFESKVQIARIVVESKSPQWHRVDLPHTRLKDVEKGELLTFKEIEWQTMRLEAQSTSDSHLAPIRLLTNQAKARVVLKKQLSDCSVIGCCLTLIMDDLLWVLTDSQILAAAHFMNSLSGLIKRATEMSHSVKAVRKLETLPEYRAQQFQSSSPQGRQANSEASRIFDAFDVKETSYHLICNKIQLHLCDDPGGRSNHPDLNDGGAGQLELIQFMLDFYPYHLAKADRRVWFINYCSDLNHWLKEALSTFQTQLLNLFPKSTGSMNFASHPESNHSMGSSRKGSVSSPDVVSARLNEQISKLMSTCLVVKIQDVCMYKVTMTSKDTPLPFISGYLERPKDIAAVNMEFTWFYYPGGTSFPLPSPKIYAQINPLQVNLDVCTILWLNSFLTNLETSLPQAHQQEGPEYVDIRMELVMPKIVFEERKRHASYKERPNGLQIQASRIIVSNYRSSGTGTRNQLATVISEVERILCEDHDPTKIIPEKFKLHAQGLDRGTHGKNPRDSGQLTGDTLWTEARDVWSVIVDTVWADFCVSPKNKTDDSTKGSVTKFRSTHTMTSQSEGLLVPFVDSVPVNIWLYVLEEQIDPEFSMGKRKDIHALLNVDGMCSVQLTHPQYIFLLRAAEAISEISLFLTMDTRKTYIVPRSDDTVQVLGCLPRLDVSLILPYTDLGDIPQDESLQLDDLESTLEIENFASSTMQAPGWVMSQGSTRIESNMAFAESNGSQEKFYSEVAAMGHESLPSVESAEGLKTVFFSEGLKQGISNIAGSFNKSTVGGQSTPDSEVTSLWSTDSSENNFITLDPVQNFPPDEEETVEVAEEVIEDNSQSTGSFCIHNPYGKEDTMEINVLTAVLNGLGISQQSEGLLSLISLQCKTLAIDECNQIPWKDFQVLFATRSKKWRTDNERNDFKTEDGNAIALNFKQSVDDVTFMSCLSSQEMTDALKQAKSTKTPRMNLMDMSGPESPIRKAITKSAHPQVQVDLDLSQAQRISLRSSTVKAVANFFEDEVPPVALPMAVSIIGADVELIEDKGPNFPPVRIQLEDSIKLTRGADGIFRVGCPCGKSKPSAEKLHILCNGDVGDRESISDLREQVSRLQIQITELQKDKSDLLQQVKRGN